MPQINDTFIDRLMQITSSASDHEFRQRLADRYRVAAEAIAPLEQAVDYDRSVLALVRGTSAGGGTSRGAVEQQIGATRQEVRQLVVQIHEIYKVLSANLNPSTEHMTATGAPTTRVDRTMSIKAARALRTAHAVYRIPDHPLRMPGPQSHSRGRRGRGG